MKAPAEAGGDGMVATIRSVQPDASGSVRISFDETHRRMVSGRMDDGLIQKLLLTAARDESNAGVRVQSMDLLKSHGNSREVRRALLDAVAHDANSGVRLKALEGLSRFASDGEVRLVLAQVLLTDETPGMRIRAIDMLTAQKDDAMVGVLQGVVDKESNSYVRSRCEKALKDMNASVGTF